MVAALLWAAVLVPTWVRRREFKAAEQNALRLQRTLRVLAETTEVPQEVRLEATAREALAQEKILRTAQRRQEAERKAELTEARTEQIRAEVRAQQLQRKQAAVLRAARLRRPIVRRVRSIAALALLLGAGATLVGLGTLIAGLGPAVLVAGFTASIAALGALVLLAPGRVKHVEIEAEKAVVTAPEKVVEPAAIEETVDHAAEAHAAAQAAAAARIERARAMARARAEGATVQKASMKNQPESILLERVDTAQSGVSEVKPSRAEQQQPSHKQPAEERKRAQEAEVRERLRNMGVVGDTRDGALNLDSVLKNRRAG